MEIKQLTRKALKLKELFDQLSAKCGQPKWTYRERTEGFVADVGALMRFIQMKSGLREDEKQLDFKISRELVDCLWSVPIIAYELGIDLDEEYSQHMDLYQKELQTKLDD